MNVSSIELFDLLENHGAIASDLTRKAAVLSHFDAYLDHGCYPFYRDASSGFAERLEQVIAQVLDVDNSAEEK